MSLNFDNKSKTNIHGINAIHNAHTLKLQLRVSMDAFKPIELIPFMRDCGFHSCESVDFYSCKSASIEKDHILLSPFLIKVKYNLSAFRTSSDMTSNPS